MAKPVDRGVTRTKQQLCPYCGYHFDAVGTDDGSEGTPSPGDASVCLNCTEAMIFEAAGVLRKPTFEELIAFGKDPEWEGLREAQARLRATQRQGFRTKQAERPEGRPQ